MTKTKKVRSSDRKQAKHESAAEFFRKRAGKATGKGLARFLSKAPRSQPEPEDALS